MSSRVRWIRLDAVERTDHRDRDDITSEGATFTKQAGGPPSASPRQLAGPSAMPPSR